MYQEITQCRICQNKNLVEIMNLGEQALTGMFHEIHEPVDIAPLVLVKCFNENSNLCCGLVQLKHTYNLSAMYGKDYGYRSSLNASMVKHLQSKVANILKRNIALKQDDLIIDIGSNDGTTLNTYPDNIATLVGIDPTAKYFRKYYKDAIHVIENFFSAKLVREKFPNQKAKIITSFSMFYDLEDPQAFTNEVADLLDDEGIWVLEQSYLPLMLSQNSFDTICHEHLEYYALEQIQWLFDRAGLKILDVDFNQVNGGSFSICAAKKNSPQTVNNNRIATALEAEKRLELHTLKPYQEFSQRIERLKQQLIEKINQIHEAGQKIYGLGASTKGNVLLQYYNLTSDRIAQIGEVNQDKLGKVTPGSKIPIVHEEDILAEKPDYLLVLPWHFKSFFKNNPRFANTKLLFPLPTLEVHHDPMV